MIIQKYNEERTDKQENLDNFDKLRGLYIVKLLDIIFNC